jgi:hypothetical protein
MRTWPPVSSVTSPLSSATSSENPQAGLEGENQHRAVAAAFPALLGWRVDERLGLMRAEEGHRALLVVFGGDRQDALDDGGVFGVTDGRVAEQRPMAVSRRLRVRALLPRSCSR